MRHFYTARESDGGESFRGCVGGWVTMGVGAREKLNEQSGKGKNGGRKVGMDDC